jgi:outer membrane protein TolC
MKNLYKNYLWFICLMIGIQSLQAQPLGSNKDDELSLNDAIDTAIDLDPWLTGSEYQQEKLNSMAVSAGQLADPTVSLGVANLATDTFAFNQEPMTHLKVGVSQMFSRGQTRKLKTEQIKLLADEQPMLRANRMAQLTRDVSHLWLDAFKAQASIRLIESDRSLFEQLVDLVDASYSSGIGKARQHDVIRAQLELTRLDDRLTQLQQAEDSNFEQLNGLIKPNYLAQYPLISSDKNFQKAKLPTELPQIKLLTTNEPEQSNDEKRRKVMALLSKHPAVLALDQQLQAENKSVDLAKQKYKPAWGVNVGYGYRDNAENNMSRADLFSVGVTFDLPLFTKNRQDQDLKAAVAAVDAMETQKILLLRQLLSSYDDATAKLNRLEQRQQLYSEDLLPQMNQQAQATLSAYTHDDGDFAEVIRAKIAELNAQIDYLDIKVSTAKIKVTINYLLTAAQTENNNSSDLPEHQNE